MVENKYKGCIVMDDPLETAKEVEEALTEGLKRFLSKNSISQDEKGLEALKNELSSMTDFEEPIITRPFQLFIPHCQYMLISARVEGLDMSIFKTNNYNKRKWKKAFKKAREVKNVKN